MKPSVSPLNTWVTWLGEKNIILVLLKAGMSHPESLPGGTRTGCCCIPRLDLVIACSELSKLYLEWDEAEQLNRGWGQALRLVSLCVWISPFKTCWSVKKVNVEKERLGMVPLAVLCFPCQPREDGTSPFGALQLQAEPFCSWEWGFYGVNCLWRWGWFLSFAVHLFAVLG